MFGKTPDITPAALIGLAVAGLTNAEIIFGVNLSPKREAALEGLVNGIFVLGFMAHDAYVRRGRANVAAAQAYAVTDVTNVLNTTPADTTEKVGEPTSTA